MLILISSQVSCDVCRSSVLLFLPHMAQKYAEKCGIHMATGIYQLPQLLYFRFYHRVESFKTFTAK